MVLPFRSILLGNPASSVNQPDSIELTTALEALQTLIEAGGLADAVFFTTKALLDADLDHAANARAVVYSDGANNGIYLKAGASGAGSWSRVLDYLPGYQIVKATDTGGGTANAISATSAPEASYTDGTQLIILNIFEDNTTDAVTVAFDGGSTLDIKTSSGNDPGAGALVAGMYVVGIIANSGTQFRLLSDLDSAAAQAAAQAAKANAESAQAYAEEWANKAEDSLVSSGAGGDEVDDYSALHWARKAEAYADAALNNWNLDSFAGDGATTDFTLSIAPGSENNTIVTIDGVVQHKGTYSLSGTTLAFSTAPPGDGVAENIQVAYGSAISVGTPSDGSVTTAKLGTAAVTNDKIGDGEIAEGKLAFSPSLPPGGVLPYMGASAPSGYLVADGSAVSRTTYADLFSVIGAIYGPGDGSTTFNLPDLRGYFLRGHDDGAGNDPDAASRTDRGDGTTGDAVGTKQAGETESHDHGGSTGADGGHSHTPSGGAYEFIRANGTVTQDAVDDAGSGATAIDAGVTVSSTATTNAVSDHSHSVTASGGSETRPTNIAVLYIIKT